ncbi:hypothetical protein BDZ94DRAFT_1242182 [Collybia nuda]|uniref:Uncharacterized protein n=1 Tax=Collybia nuda TaxID=64659 RepID=A0A9P5XPW9_9AGAR|nr:hypothetical protein BDZ94DRAFT_1242204 [Collybia nuda]KAF9455533.1 hypothetical protein BDZ94DRAFT_1242182 [Collybia nuda]
MTIDKDIPVINKSLRLSNPATMLIGDECKRTAIINIPIALGYTSASASSIYMLNIETWIPLPPSNLAETNVVDLSNSAYYVERFPFDNVIKLQNPLTILYADQVTVVLQSNVVFDLILPTVQALAIPLSEYVTRWYGNIVIIKHSKSGHIIKFTRSDKLLAEQIVIRETIHAKAVYPQCN